MCNSISFAGCVLPVRQVCNVLGRLFGLPYLRSLSNLQTCCLAFSGFAVDPLITMLLNTLKIKDAHPTLSRPSRYKHSLAHVSLEPNVDLTEESLEHWVGQRKAFLAKRGAHTDRDLLREFVADEAAARARADYGLEERARPVEAKAPASCFERGMLLCGPALSDVNVRSAFAAARRRVSPELRALFVELPSQWLITARPAVDLANADWRQLRADHDVICMCNADDCEHV